MCQGTSALATGSLAQPIVSGRQSGAGTHDTGGASSLIRLDVDQHNGNRSRITEKDEGEIVIGSDGHVQVTATAVISRHMASVLWRWN